MRGPKPHFDCNGATSDVASVAESEWPPAADVLAAWERGDGQTTARLPPPKLLPRVVSNAGLHCGECRRTLPAERRRRMQRIRSGNVGRHSRRPSQSPTCWRNVGRLVLSL